MSDIKWKMKDHRNCFDLRKDFNLIIMNRNKKIYKTLKLYHINVLVITSSKPKKISGFEEIHIIDYDLCLIVTYDN